VRGEGKYDKTAGRSEGADVRTQLLPSACV
jgi:hypothetical protein